MNQAGPQMPSCCKYPLDQKRTQVRERGPSSTFRLAAAVTSEAAMRTGLPPLVHGASLWGIFSPAQQGSLGLGPRLWSQTGVVPLSHWDSVLCEEVTVKAPGPPCGILLLTPFLPPSPPPLAPPGRTAAVSCFQSVSHTAAVDLKQKSDPVTLVQTLRRLPVMLDVNP